MSTRSAIIVKGQGLYGGTGAVRLYKHCDGYPTGNLPVIRDAIKLATKLQDKANARWKENKAVSLDCFAGAVVASTLDVHGLSAQIEEKGKDIKDVLGNQGDIEWVYIIDLDKKNVNIYSGTTYQGQFLKRGTVNPETYAECMKEEYKASERKAIKAAVKSIERLGFSVNK